MFTISLVLFFFLGIAIFVGGVIFVVKITADKWKEYDFSSFIKDEWNK